MIQTFWTLLAWLAQHPGESVAGGILLAMAGFILAGLFMAWWSSREEQRQDAERTRLHHQIARIQQADARPKAAGWPSRRVS